MCGIAGIVGKNSQEKELREMLRLISHRGPDHTAFYIDPGFAEMGHNRLSIIDLSPEANQPFIDNTSRYCLSFNGEIYNYKELRLELRSEYKFKTESDTEVLLAAYIKWEEHCLDRLNGMFSFAIWDTKTKSLFAARDRLGVKPFYYSLDHDTFIFASEIKAICSQRESNNPNAKVWASYFKYGLYGMPKETFYEDIFQLPAGHFLKYSDERLRIKKWYNFPKNVLYRQNEIEYDEARAYYFQLLKDSLALRFRSDVPLGFNLSGGVDSSLLLSLVNLFEDRRNIKAFTFNTGDERYDELPWVQKMIQHTKNPLEEVRLTATRAIECISSIAQQQDEPFGGIPTLAYAGIFKEASKQGIKVLLDGQGMDEQWAGYDYYFKNSSATIQGTGGMKVFKDNVLSPDFSQLADKPEYPEPFTDSLRNLQYRDLFYTKLPRALRFNDRISMAYGTELREPFLDYRLVEFATGLPASFKRKGDLQKFMIRDILKAIAPSEVSYAPKRALQTPQREWFADEMKDYVEAQLLHLKKSSHSSWFNHNAINKEWESYLNGNNKSSFHIWQWVNAAILLK